MIEARLVKDRATFDQFVTNHPNTHYMKTSMWGEFQHKTSHFKYEMVGFYNEGELVGTALLLEKTWLGVHYIFIPVGPCIDYNDKQLVKDVYNELSSIAKKKNVAFLRLSPNVLRKERDIHGNAIENGSNNEDITTMLSSLGYKHHGYTYAYDGSWINRYTLIVDLSDDMDTIISRFDKQRKTALNRHAVSGVQTKLASMEDIPYLMDFEKQLTKIEGFKPHSKQFFIDLLTTCASNARFYITTINLQEMIDGIEKELAGKKYRKDKEARNAKERDLKRAKDLMEIYGTSTPIACGVFVHTGTYSYDLYTYNHKEFNFIKPVDNLHAFAMQDMKSFGVTHYDMCGFSGVTTRDDPFYGLYNYKRSFGATYIEYIGQFDFINKPKSYQFFNKMWSYYRRFARKMAYITHHKKETE